MAFTEPTDGRGERPAIVDGRGVNTHADLLAAAARVATSLAGPNGDASGARVALLIAPGFEFAAVLRGVWQAGGVAVPLAVTDPAAELDYSCAIAAPIRSSPARGLPTPSRRSRPRLTCGCARRTICSRRRRRICRQWPPAAAR